MEANSLDTGMNAVQSDAVLEIARLPYLTPDLLAFVQGALLLINRQTGTVSIESLLAELDDNLLSEQVEILFFALVEAEALIRQNRDRRGLTFDRYQLMPDRLRWVMHDATVALKVLKQIEASEKQVDQVELIATLPESLPLDSATRHSVPSLVAALHRVITEAEKQIIILNPFFEQTGFDRLATALLTAAARGVATIIITRQLTDSTSVNWRVLDELFRHAKADNLSSCFKFYEYQLVEKERIVLTSHAKVLLADEQSAYVGSANLTEYGMTHFVEVGVCLKGPLIRKLRQILQGILDSTQTKEVHFQVE